MKRNTKLCNNCNRQISLSNYAKHTPKCKGSYSVIQTLNTIQLVNNSYQCLYCFKTYTKNGIATHIIRNHTDRSWDPNSGYKFGRKPTNQFIKGTWQKDKPPQAWLKNIRESNAKRVYSSAIIEKLRQKAINEEFGGKNSFKVYNYICKDGSIVKLQSSYEVQVAKILDQNNISWIRPKFLRWKDQEGRIHRYYPDFYLPEYDIYFDPKNDFLIEKDTEKINQVCRQNQIKLFILAKSELNFESISSYLS